MNDAKRREKFLSNITVDPETGCWIWNGMKFQSGYGRVKRDGKTLSAHRYSYLLHKGDPGVMVVMHSCDNKPCINPDHLSLGTHQDNQLDKLQKGRHTHGEQSPHAKLTEAQVKTMYDLHESGVGTIRLSAMFKVTKNLAWMIVTGRSWKHLYAARYGVGGPVRT